MRTTAALAALACLLASAFAAPVAPDASSGATHRSKVPSNSPSRMEGVPIFRRYGPETHGADAHTYSTTINAQGELFFATRDGLLRHSGGRFSLIEASKDLEATAIDACADGAIAVGTVNDIGEIRRSAQGVYEWKSAQTQHHGHGQIWTTLCVGDARYYVASRQVFLVRAGKTEVFSAPKRLNHGYKIDEGVVFVGETGGQYILGPKKTLVTMPNFLGEQKDIELAGQRGRDVVVFYAGNQPQQQRRAFLGTPSTWSRIDTADMQSVLAQHPYVARSPDGESLVVGTLSGHVWWLDKNFNARFVSELNSGGVLDLSFDKEGTIWVGTERGLYSIAWPSRWTHYVDDQGEISNPRNLFRHKGVLWLASNNGLFKLNAGRFEHFGLSKEQAFNIVDSAEGPLVAYGSGVFGLESNQEVKAFEDLVIDDLHRPTAHPEALFTLQEDGISLFRYVQSKWMPVWQIANRSGTFEVLELTDSRYFIASDEPFVIELGSDLRVVKQHMVSSVNKLQSPSFFVLQGEVYAGTRQYLQKLNVYKAQASGSADRYRFEPATELSDRLPPSPELVSAYESKSGHQWLLGRKQIFLRGSAEQKFESIPLPRAGLSFDCMFPDGLSMLFCDTLSLLRLKPVGVDPAFAQEKQTRLDSVSVDGVAHAVPADGVLTVARNQVLKLIFTSNTNINPVRYRWRMLDLGEPAGEWSEPQENFGWQLDDLAPGEYQFEVQAKPALSDFALPAVQRIRVTGRWWEYGIGRTLAASLMLMALLTLIILAQVWRSRALAAQARRLTMQIEDRTRSLSSQALALERANRSLEELAMRDGLTEVANRRQLDARLRQLVDAADGFSLVLLDLDYFKAYNDHFGHLAGDDLLRACAQGFAKQVQMQHPAGLLARFGGEEFAALLPNCTLARAQQIAEALRADLQANHAETGVSVSAGVSTKRSGDDAESVLGRADAALYRAKAKGRNRVEGEA